MIAYFSFENKYRFRIRKLSVMHIVVIAEMYML